MENQSRAKGTGIHSRKDGQEENGVTVLNKQRSKNWSLEKQTFTQRHECGKERRHSGKSIPGNKYNQRADSAKALWFQETVQRTLSLEGSEQVGDRCKEMSERSQTLQVYLCFLTVTLSDMRNHFRAYSRSNTGCGFNSRRTFCLLCCEQIIRE